VSIWLTITEEGGNPRSVAVLGDEFVIGRESDCNLVLDDTQASRHHAVIRPVQAPGGPLRWVIEDQGSTNGTIVNGVAIETPYVLRGGERIQIGRTSLITSDEAPRGAPAGSPPRLSTDSVIERLRMARSLRAAWVVAGAALLVALAAVAGVALVLTSGGGDHQAGPGTAPRSVPTLPDIIRAMRPSTVLVIASVGGSPESTGSGWVLDASQGLIVTNHHVVNGAESLQVGVGEDRRAATIVGTAPCEDLALLHVDDTSGLRTMQLADQATLEQGENVVALGYPVTGSGEYQLVATSGIVSVVQERFDIEALDVPHYPNVVQTDAAINPGNSGGPLIDMRERLVGVNSAGITRSNGRTIQGQGYAIGVDRVKQIVATLRERRSLGWTGLGLDYPTSASSLSSLGLPVETGLIGTNAYPGTPASRAGLGRQPVLILSVNGRHMDGTLAGYCSAVKSTPSGGSVVLRYAAAGGSLHTVRLKLV
jgi:serine protease DegQ